MMHFSSSSNRLNQNSFVYSQVDACGWGRTTFGGVPSTSLQKVALTIISNSECNRSYPYQISGAQMCTFTALKDTCDVSNCFLIYSEHRAKYFSYFGGFEKKTLTQISSA